MTGRTDEECGTQVLQASEHAHRGQQRASGAGSRACWEAAQRLQESAALRAGARGPGEGPPSRLLLLACGFPFLLMPSSGLPASSKLSQRAGFTFTKLRTSASLHFKTLHKTKGKHTKMRCRKC